MSRPNPRRRMPISTSGAIEITIQPDPDVFCWQAAARWPAGPALAGAAIRRPWPQTGREQDHIRSGRARRAADRSSSISTLSSRARSHTLDVAAVARGGATSPPAQLDGVVFRGRCWQRASRRHACSPPSGTAAPVKGGDRFDGLARARLDQDQPGARRRDVPRTWRRRTRHGAECRVGRTSHPAVRRPRRIRLVSAGDRSRRPHAAADRT